jgi:hypothetical protein
MKNLILPTIFLFLFNNSFAQFSFKVQADGALQSFFPKPEDEYGRKTPLGTRLMSLKLGAEYINKKSKGIAEFGISQDPLVYPVLFVLSIFGRDEGTILKPQRSICLGYGRKLENNDWLELRWNNDKLNDEIYEFNNLSLNTYKLNYNFSEKSRYEFSSGVDFSQIRMDYVKFENNKYIRYSNQKITGFGLNVRLGIKLGQLSK